jgi:hypothetical protein
LVVVFAENLSLLALSLCHNDENGTQPSLLLLFLFLVVLAFGPFFSFVLVLCSTLLRVWHTDVIVVVVVIIVVVHSRSDDDACWKTVVVVVVRTPQAVRAMGTPLLGLQCYYHRNHHHHHYYCAR